MCLLHALLNFLVQSCIFLLSLLVERGGKSYQNHPFLIVQCYQIWRISCAKPSRLKDNPSWEGGQWSGIQEEKCSGSRGCCRYSRGQALSLQWNNSKIVSVLNESWIWPSRFSKYWLSESVFSLACKIMQLVLQAYFFKRECMSLSSCAVH